MTSKFHNLIIAPIQEKIPSSSRQRFLILCFIVISIMNIIVFSLDRRKIAAFQRIADHMEIGQKFQGIDAFTKEIPVIGYYTDKSLDDENAARDFSQAQYIVAPTVLDIESLNHRFIILSCSSDAVAFSKIKDLGATPLKRNQFGVILAQREGFKE